jgi:hypothetical protein
MTIQQLTRTLSNITGKNVTHVEDKEYYILSASDTTLHPTIVKERLHNLVPNTFEAKELVDYIIRQL